MDLAGPKLGYQVLCQVLGQSFSLLPVGLFVLLAFLSLSDTFQFDHPGVIEEERIEYIY